MSGLPVYVLLLNRLYTIDAYVCHTTFSMRCHFWQRPWDLGSAPAERAGQGEVGGFYHWAQVTWLLLGLVIENPWLELGGPFLSTFAQMGFDFWPCRAFIGQEPSLLKAC